MEAADVRAPLLCIGLLHQKEEKKNLDGLYGQDPVRSSDGFDGMLCVATSAVAGVEQDGSVLQNKLRIGITGPNFIDVAKLRARIRNSSRSTLQVLRRRVSADFYGPLYAISARYDIRRNELSH
ncbi:hypothetical protein N9U05_00345 [bacterium]|nr:hypothetical protein [bacterium]